MRKYFIDNIRSFIILLLIPIHILAMYNGLGIDFNILLDPFPGASVALAAMAYWCMPVLFLLAGCSARYSLGKRSIKQYAAERVTKLLLPLAAGVILFLPLQGYYTERFRTGFTGSVLDEYILFFTGTGNTLYDSGFNYYSISHLWFLMHLFVISVITLPLLARFVKKGCKSRLDKAPVRAILVIGCAIYLCLDLVLFGMRDKNPLNNLWLFLLGFYCFSRDDAQEALTRFRLLFTAVTVIAFIIGCLFLWKLPFVYALFSFFAVLSALGWGRKILDLTNGFWRYMRKASFGIYLFHMTWVIAISYYLLKAGASPAVHIAVTMVLSFAVTIATYELARRIPGVRFVFALPKPKPKKS